MKNRIKVFLLVAIAMLANISFAQDKNEKGTVSLAKEILGNNFLGPDEVFKVFGVKVKIDEFPFTKNDLNEFKKLDLVLLLQIDKDPKGKPLTMDNIMFMMDNHFSNHIQIEHMEGPEADRKQLNIIHSPFDYENKEVPKLGWRVISKNVLEKSLNEDYKSALLLERKFFKSNLSNKIDDYGTNAVEFMYFIVLFERVNHAMPSINCPVFIWTRSLSGDESPLVPIPHVPILFGFQCETSDKKDMNINSPEFKSGIEMWTYPVGKKSIQIGIIPSFFKK